MCFGPIFRFLGRLKRRILRKVFGRPPGPELVECVPCGRILSPGPLVRCRVFLDPPPVRWAKPPEPKLEIPHIPRTTPPSGSELMTARQTKKLQTEVTSHLSQMAIKDPRQERGLTEDISELSLEDKGGFDDSEIWARCRRKGRFRANETDSESDSESDSDSD